MFNLFNTCFAQSLSLSLSPSVCLSLSLSISLSLSLSFPLSDPLTCLVSYHLLLVLPNHFLFNHNQPPTNIFF